jgi:tetratricopeptide (TPR) repeat protein
MRAKTVLERTRRGHSPLLRKCLAVFVTFLLISVENVEASFLSEITGIDINIPAGTINFSAPKPQAIPEMLKNLPADVLKLLNPYGLKLAFLIREARTQALNGAQPIPSNIRSLLSPFFPAYILDKVRWNVYDSNRITLDSLILGSDCSDLNLPFNIDCKMGAITFDNVVIFRGAAGAQNYVSWAHELVHVSQYDSMGIDGFAFVYASPGAYSLEKQAYDWQATVGNAIQSGAEQQTYWTVAAGPRPALPANAFYAAANQFLSDPVWAASHQLDAGNTQLDCAAIRGPGTDTGISMQASTDHFNRGNAFESQGNIQEAIVEYLQAVQSNRTNATAYDRLGLLLVRTGQRAEGIKNLQKAVCYDGSQDAYRQHLSSAVRASSGPTPGVVQPLFNVFHNPGDYSYRLQLSTALRQSGDTDEAAVQQWAAEQMRPPDGGPVYATVRDRLISDWVVDFDDTNPISNVRSRTRLTLRRLDSCMLSWNARTEALNTSSPTVKSFTDTVDLRRIKPQDISLTGGNQVALSNSNRDAIKSSLVVQVDYAYVGKWNQTQPLFALLRAPTYQEADALVPLLRNLANSCQE